MTDRDALLQAICENPDDDAPRLVYADWLDEHGDPLQAEFVRAQVELARVPDHDARAIHPLAGKLAGLWGQFDQWRYVIGDWRQQALYNYERGFPKAWDGTIDAFLVKCGEYWRFGPVAELHLDFDTGKTSEPPDAKRVAQCPILGVVRELELAGWRLTDKWVNTFLESPYGTSWKSLKLRSKQLSDALCRPLVQSVLARTNCHLMIYQSQITSEGRSILEGAFPSERLRIHHTHLTG